jgi:hypothetical protein
MCSVGVFLIRSLTTVDAMGKTYRNFRGKRYNLYRKSHVCTRLKRLYYLLLILSLSLSLIFFYYTVKRIKIFKAVYFGYRYQTG